MIPGLPLRPRRPPVRELGPRTFNDYRRMFDVMHKEIDAVLVATPDHHHAPASMRAIKHGKHVFCEKPLCHDIAEARALAKAARQHKVTTMMGNQGHCADGYRTALRIHLGGRDRGCDRDP